MISYIEQKTVQSEPDAGGELRSVVLSEMRGLSTDEKPTQNVANGSSFIEMDTGRIFFFDEANGRWLDFTGGGT